MAHFDTALVGSDRFLMQLGTLSGNPIAPVAGLKTMEILRRDRSYEKLGEIGQRLMTMFGDALKRAGHAHQIVGEPALFDVVFTANPIADYRAHKLGDQNKNARFNQTLGANGVLKSPGKLYPSLALTDDDLTLTQQAVALAANSL